MLSWGSAELEAKPESRVPFACGAGAQGSMRPAAVPYSLVCGVYMPVSLVGGRRRVKAPQARGANPEARGRSPLSISSPHAGSGHAESGQ